MFWAKFFLFFSYFYGRKCLYRLAGLVYFDFKFKLELYALLAAGVGGGLYKNIKVCVKVTIF